jgi:hypothetical protein
VKGLNEFLKKGGKKGADEGNISELTGNLKKRR